MIPEDFHTHTTFSDGRSSPAEMAEAAAARGLSRLGFSDHGYTSFDTGCCMPRERVSEYQKTVAALKDVWRGKLEIFCGVEQDFYCDFPAEGFDYVIGCVHYLKLDGGYYCVDDRLETLLEITDRFFGRDPYGMVEEYFRTEARVVRQTRCDLIGHFDLIAKLNERYRLFDVSHPRYLAAWKAAADALLETGKPFEINTGGMSRGWRSVPYPAPDIVRYLAERGARFVLSSDSHQTDTLCYDFAEQAHAAAARGARVVRFEI